MMVANKTYPKVYRIIKKYYICTKMNADGCRVNKNLPYSVPCQAWLIGIK